LPCLHCNLLPITSMIRFLDEILMPVFSSNMTNCNQKKNIQKHYNYDRLSITLLLRSSTLPGPTESNMDHTVSLFNRNSVDLYTFNFPDILEKQCGHNAWVVVRSDSFQPKPPTWKPIKMSSYNLIIFRVLYT